VRLTNKNLAGGEEALQLVEVERQQLVDGGEEHLLVRGPHQQHLEVTELAHELAAHAARRDETRPRRLRAHVDPLEAPVS